MTREEATDNVRKIKNYMCAGNPMWDTRTIEQTLDMTIEALEQPEIVLCKDCVFGHLCFDVHNDTDTDSWVECTNPDGLYRDVSCEGYCYAAIRREGE